MVQVQIRFGNPWFAAQIDSLQKLDVGFSFVDDRIAHDREGGDAQLGQGRELAIGDRLDIESVLVRHRGKQIQLSHLFGSSLAEIHGGEIFRQSLDALRAFPSQARNSVGGDVARVPAVLIGHVQAKPFQVERIRNHRSLQSGLKVVAGKTGEYSGAVVIVHGLALNQHIVRRQIKSGIIWLKPPAIVLGKAGHEIEILGWNVAGEDSLVHLRLSMPFIRIAVPGDVDVGLVEFADHYVVDLFDESTIAFFQTPIAILARVHGIESSVVAPIRLFFASESHHAIQIGHSLKEPAEFVLHRIPKSRIGGRQLGA